MIIFGTRAKTTDLDEGEFFCPMCQARRRYVHKQARPHFALYFIPLFPVGQGTEFVECQTCGRAFEPGVLALQPPERKPDLARLLNTIKPQLAAGAPIEYVLRDLTANGLDFEVARGAVEAQLDGPARSRCAACGLAYAPTVTTCAACGGALQRDS